MSTEIWHGRHFSERFLDPPVDDDDEPHHECDHGYHQDRQHKILNILWNIWVIHFLCSDTIAGPDNNQVGGQDIPAIEDTYMAEIYFAPPTHLPNG